MGSFSGKSIETNGNGRDVSSNCKKGGTVGADELRETARGHGMADAALQAFAQGGVERHTACHGHDGPDARTLRQAERAVHDRLVHAGGDAGNGRASGQFGDDLGFREHRAR